MGKCAEALASTEIAESLLAGSDTPATRSWLGFTYARCGQAEKAQAALAAMQQMAETEYVDPALFAGLYLGLRDLDQSISYFEQALAERSPWRGLFSSKPGYFYGRTGTRPPLPGLDQRNRVPGNPLGNASEIVSGPPLAVGWT